jgi:hypothetical protein
MKKFILIILLIFLMIPPANALVSTSDSITAIENSVFGYDYKNESEIKRLERLEQHLYGQKKSGDVLKRIQNIQNDTGFTSKEEKAFQKPSSTAQKTPTMKNAQNQQNEMMNLKEDSSVEYPIVDKMEQEIFKTTYKNENIYNRLNRLEEKVFKKTSNEDLNSRVNKLSTVVISSASKRREQDSFNYTDREMNNYYANSGMQQIDNSNLPFELSVLEEELLKRTYANENTALRLNRIEQKLFNRNFPNDNDVMRLQRALVAYDAKKNSYKYDSNRRMQNMATMTQLSGILLMILAMIL